jgi:tetratricopeptide (TPR) repeat protein
MERYDKAVEYYKESIRVTPNRYQVEALLGLGRNYLRIGKHEEALAAFEQGIQYASTPRQFSVEDEIGPWLLPALYFDAAQGDCTWGADRPQSRPHASTSRSEPGPTPTRPTRR